MIPYGRQSLDHADLEAVAEVLRSDWLTQGPAIPRFEAALAKRCQAAHAIAVNSATSALHLACLALGVGPGDVVWTSPNTFVASANCARYCGADVDFVDIDPATGNMDAAILADKLATARASGGQLPKVVIPVHFAGNPCDMDALSELARDYGFRLIEDASHAVGATLNGLPIGCGKWADITVFSFHPVKIITTGEGGALLTNHPDLARRLERLRSHGITRAPSEMDHPTEAPWYYEQIELGLNYRITDIQAALGTSQLAKLDCFVARRRDIAARYSAELEGLGLILPAETHAALSSWHLYPVRTDRRDAVFHALRARGIGVQVHYIPVHCQPYYRRLGFGPGQFPNAETHGATAVSLPMFPAMTDDHVGGVIAAVRAVLAE